MIGDLERDLEALDAELDPLDAELDPLDAELDPLDADPVASSLAMALAEADPVPSETPGDPFFAGRVLAVLPTRVRGASLSPTRRARVLAAFYGGGLALAAIVAVVVPEALGLWSDRAHSLAHDASHALPSDVLSLSAVGDGVPWLLALGVSAVLVGGALALFGVRVDTPAT